MGYLYILYRGKHTEELKVGAEVEISQLEIIWINRLFLLFPMDEVYDSGEMVEGLYVPMNNLSLS